jgi:sugar lactone lactonase YvrE
VPTADVTRWTATPASAEAYHLGEGPLWNPGRQLLHWVDITTGTVHTGRLAEERVEHLVAHRVDATVGAVALGPGDELLVAGEHTLLVLDAGAGGAVRPGVRLLPAGSASRLNDGGCDPAGRFLVGSLSRDGRRGHEVLVRVEADGGTTLLDDDLDLSNGIAWSPDGRRLYSVDSVPGVVRVRPYDVGSGAVGPRRQLLHVDGGSPDGLCVDADGDLWVAVYGAGEVRRYTPSGVLTGVVEVAAPHPTCPAFAGPDLDVLVVSTATENLDDDALRRAPDSGRLFTARVGARGLPSTPWRPVGAHPDRPA